MNSGNLDSNGSGPLRRSSASRRNPFATIMDNLEDDRYGGFESNDCDPPTEVSESVHDSPNKIEDPDSSDDQPLETEGQRLESELQPVPSNDQSLKTNELSIQEKIKSNMKKLELLLPGEDYYDAVSGTEEVLYKPEMEGFLSREGIPNCQMKPPNSRRLAYVINHDPEQKHDLETIRLNLWRKYMQRELTAQMTIVHPVKDLEIYKLRNCMTCHQKEKELEFEKKGRDRFEPQVHEYMIDDLEQGLLQLISDVRTFHQEHMFVQSFLDLYLNNHFGNEAYQTYDLKTVQEELRKVNKMRRCYAETVFAVSKFHSKEEVDEFSRNSGMKYLLGKKDSLMTARKLQEKGMEEK